MAKDSEDKKGTSDEESKKLEEGKEPEESDDEDEDGEEGDDDDDDGDGDDDDGDGEEEAKADEKRAAKATSQRPPPKPIKPAEDNKLPYVVLAVAIAASLWFVVKEGGVDKKGATSTTSASATASAAQNAPPVDDHAEVTINDVVVGTGATAERGDTVSVHYVGTLTDGKEFDASRKHGKPFEFKLGAGRVIKGWDQGVQGMKVGGKRKLVIPPSLGYGARGAGADIPPNSTLLFEIELLDVRKPGEEPDAGPPYTLEEATKGLPGTGSIVATIKTGKGALTCKLYEDKAPITVANFVGLATGKRKWMDPTGNWVNKPAYDGTTFHRVVKGFMIQGGDPTGTGGGQPGYTIKDEIWTGGKHDKAGLICMANRGPNTNGQQFFITDAATPQLDGKYTIFGECSPESVIHDIAGAPVKGEKPEQPVKIEKVTIARGGK